MKKSNTRAKPRNRWIKFKATATSVRPVDKMTIINVKFIGGQIGGGAPEDWYWNNKQGPWTITAYQIIKKSSVRSTPAAATGEALQGCDSKASATPEATPEATPGEDTHPESRVRYELMGCDVSAELFYKYGIMKEEMSSVNSALVSIAALFMLIGLIIGVMCKEYIVAAAAVLGA